MSSAEDSAWPRYPKPCGATMRTASSRTASANRRTSSAWTVGLGIVTLLGLPGHAEVPGMAVLGRRRGLAGGGREPGDPRLLDEERQEVLIPQPRPDGALDQLVHRGRHRHRDLEGARG